MTPTTDCQACEALVGQPWWVSLKSPDLRLALRPCEDGASPPFKHREAPAKPKRRGTTHDFAVTARRVEEQAIGDNLTVPSVQAKEPPKPAQRFPRKNRQ